MKCLSVLFLFAVSGTAADFIDGQAARLVIGQETFTSQLDAPSEKVFGGVGGVAWAPGPLNGMLFVADSSRAGALPVNNRVLVYPWLDWLPKPTDPLSYDIKCPVCRGSATVVLGQPDVVTTTQPTAATQNDLRTPSAVATDGTHLVVADTDQNRVLIWNHLPLDPKQINSNADVVVGQPSFTTASIPGQTPNAKSLRGPQGVWIAGGKLYIADTQNHRVLIYNSIPTSNGAAADVVLGQPNFTSFVEPDISQAKVDGTASNMLNPTSVTTDATHLFVSDLGHHRVLIWNKIPTTNGAPADVVIGQPDFTSAIPNYTSKLDPTDSAGLRSIKVLCDQSKDTAGNLLTDTNNNAVFPPSCKSTLSFPRYALSNGTQLFIADGGNDRVLVYKTIPTQNAAAADVVIGQLGGDINQASDAVDSLRTPIGMAWGDNNLYVADSYNRRIMVYTMGDNNIPYSGVRNAASFDIFAVGTVTIAGTIQAGDAVTITIGTTVNGTANTVDYKYTILKNDTVNTVVQALVDLINANGGDANVRAYPNLSIGAVLLKAKASGDTGNQITLKTTLSTNAVVTATASGANLAGGQDAAKIAPGTIVTVIGSNLADSIAVTPAGTDPLPNELAGVQVYFNGIRAPLLSVSKVKQPDGSIQDQINAQVPFEFTDTTSVNAFVRTVRRDGSVTVTTPVAITIVPQNPGIFLQQSNDPDFPKDRAAAVHSSSHATGTISVDGTAHAGDVATVTIEDRTYTYTVQDGDTLNTIRDGLIQKINQDPKVSAFAAGSFDRIRLQARVEGPDGNGIKIGASAPAGSSVIMTATNTHLCCANVAGALITDDNPALPGETIVVFATGLGMPKLNDNNSSFIKTGVAYRGPVGPDNDPASFVSSLAGGKTANVLGAGLQTGAVGIYYVELELNSDLATNTLTQLTIAQDVYVSNIVTLPVVNPND